MDPMDSSQFTEQLVQFSGVEQQIKSNEQLENLASMMTSSNALGVLNFVGTTVTIDGSQSYLNDFWQHVLQLQLGRCRNGRHFHPYSGRHDRIHHE